MRRLLAIKAPNIN